MRRNFFVFFCELVNKVQFSQTPDWCQLSEKKVINILSISERSQEKLLELLLELPTASHPDLSDLSVQNRETDVQKELSFSFC